MRTVLLMFVLALLGCGQRGALYLPEEASGELVGGQATGAEGAGEDAESGGSEDPDSTEREGET